MSNDLLYNKNTVPAQTHEKLYWYIDESKRIPNAIIERTQAGILGIRFSFASDGGESPYASMEKLAVEYVSECHYHNKNLYVGKPRQIYSCNDLAIKQIIPILDVIDIMRRDLVEGDDLHRGYLDIPTNLKPRTSQPSYYHSIDISHITDPKPFFNRPKDFYLFCTAWGSSLYLFYQGFTSYNLITGITLGGLGQLTLKRLLGYKTAKEEEKIKN
ncbi:hypothetical protein L4C39_14665 [Vibrio clamense]|uniref:hypothetical protein n=1 Tax=Vibrio clamense TaxID=2910254 RepID=UPI003D1942E8